MMMFVFSSMEKKSIKSFPVHLLYIVNIYNKAHGPAHKNRKLCVNETDFLSLENLSDIPQTQFFSYKENDGFIYGYDIFVLINSIPSTF